MKRFLFAILTVLIFCSCQDNYTPDTVQISNTSKTPSAIPFKKYLGVNAFEWDFVDEKVSSSVIDEKRMALIKSFGGIRHYLDWDRMEAAIGKYTFNPTHNGGAYYDVIYKRLKDDNIEALACIKNVPKWLVTSYPKDEQGYDNTPVQYGYDKSNPKSYITQAKMAFQFAARYGANQNIDKSLISVDTSIRCNGDDANILLVGLDLIKFVECNNEPDKWWKGKRAQQTAEEYAANMSAFYDGHKGTMGKNVGVKNADSSMQVVMGGLGVAEPKFVEKMIEWCKNNRGLKANGSINLCFDVINYHLYSNNSFLTGKEATVGVAPELSDIGSVANKFISIAKKHAPGIEVWVTETGYDIGKTPQHAIPIKEKSSLITQADWNLRTSLLYARHGISRCMFYMLDDAGGLESKIQYSSSGFHDEFKPRPSADYMLQTKKLIGDYFYTATISNEPIVDLYKKGTKQIYVLTIPDQQGRTASYQLNLGNSKQAIIHSLQIGKNEMLSKKVNIKNGKLIVNVTETPIFVEKL
ncbi:hypothetical protein QWY86_19445 [Pedobacter aquatilis]|uniref:hypothetical protein n=1 Tax=Pedobacter aquatilis TaxID=351343 RepID=UPI0025B29CFA|nr:hypothetical protein [Pedobacter aquatilis]MDN3588862.1 hypothetical protein [Pedobacter aquatilis]